MCQWMANTAGTSTPYANYTVPTYIGWGTANGSNATTVQLPASQPGSFPTALSTAGTGQWSDVAPFAELTEARTNGVATVANNVAAGSYSTTQIVGTITASTGENVGESFLAFSATKPYETTLFTAITNVATSMTVSTVWPAVSVPFYLQLDNEVVEVSATASTTTATIVRAQNGSAAAAHNATIGVSLGNIPGSGTANPNHGDMFAHAGFVALALNSGDSIQFTWQVNVTS